MDKSSHVRRFEGKKVIAEFRKQKRELIDLPNMMASSVAVQGLGMISVSRLFSVGNTLAGVVLCKELAARFPLKKMGYKYYLGISMLMLIQSGLQGNFSVREWNVGQVENKTRGCPAFVHSLYNAWMPLMSSECSLKLVR